MVQGVQGLVSGCYPQCASSTGLSSVSSIGLGKQHVHAEEHLETLLMSFDSYIDSDSSSSYSSSTSIPTDFHIPLYPSLSSFHWKYDRDQHVNGHLKDLIEQGDMHMCPSPNCHWSAYDGYTPQALIHHIISEHQVPKETLEEGGDESEAETVKDSEDEADSANVSKNDYSDSEHDSMDGDHWGVEWGDVLDETLFC